MNSNVNKRVCKILQIASRLANKVEGCTTDNYIGNITLHYNGYAEPGYSEPKSGIIALGNWNKVDVYVREAHGPGTQGARKVISDLPVRVGKLFEKLGVETEWSDEWCECGSCGKLVRTQPDSYDWKRSYVEGDGEIVCHECVLEDPELHLESLEGKNDMCNTISSIDPSEYGYVRVSTYETGFHTGQNDKPSDVAKALEEKGIQRYLFTLDQKGQFDVKWSVWVFKTEVSKMKRIDITKYDMQVLGILR